MGDGEIELRKRESRGRDGKLTERENWRGGTARDRRPCAAAWCCLTKESSSRGEPPTTTHDRWPCTAIGRKKRAKEEERFIQPLEELSRSELRDKARSTERKALRAFPSGSTAISWLRNVL
ncbi:hypothetical protein KSP39_PZI023597 [Platanthera zijinensis]|uniref:Uncharacterized protein n=1 Tax=Platanthera zijinensis TaxID=2320716 RepID=A0AAP0AS44_9ASPA